MDNLFDTIIGVFKKLTEAGIALIALAIVLQVIFGGDDGMIPFVGSDVIGTITDIIGALGGEGLVGLAAVAVIYAIFNR